MLYRLNDGFGRAAENMKDSSWLIFRVLASAMFMTHGYDKLLGANPQPFSGSGMTEITIGSLASFPMPLEINALFIAGIVELGGGAFILLGLWTHLFAFLALLQMVMAYLIAHLAWFPTLNGGELAAMYWLAYLLLFVYGPGMYSLDTLLAERRQEKRRAGKAAAGVE